MASSVGHVVVLQVNGLERPVFEKQAKTATVKPGHLLEISTGKVQPNSVAGAASVKMLAVEHGLLDGDVVRQDGSIADSQPQGGLAPGGAKVLNAFLNNKPGAFLGDQGFEATVVTKAAGHGRTPGVGERFRARTATIRG